jgi:hypothetical protein
MRPIVNTAGRFAARAYRLALIAVAWLGCAVPAWAQQAGEEEGGKSYVLPYVLVVLVIILGLVVVLRPVGRATEIKWQPDE